MTSRVMIPAAYSSAGAFAVGVTGMLMLAASFMGASVMTTVELNGGPLTHAISHETGGVPFLISSTDSEPVLVLSIGAISSGRHALIEVDSDLSARVFSSPEAMYDRLYNLSSDEAQVYLGPLQGQLGFVTARTLVAQASRIASSATGRRGWSRASQSDVLLWIDELDSLRRTDALSRDERIYAVAAVALLLAYRVGVRAIDYAPLSGLRDPAMPEVPLAALSAYRAVDVLGLARIAERTRQDARVTLRDLFAMSFLLLERGALASLPRELLAPDVTQWFVIPTQDGFVAGTSPEGEPFRDPETSLAGED